MNIMDIFKGKTRFVVIILFVAVIVAIVYVIGGAPQPTSVAVAVLTILVAIVAIIMGYTSLRTQSEWRKFKEETWENAERRLEELEESQKEINYLKQHIKTDPLLLHDVDREQLMEFAKVFIEGQDMLPLKFYFAGRAYENGYDPNISIEEQLKKSIQYYEKALDCEKALGYEMGSETKRRIYQAMGTSEFGLGKEYSAKREQSKAMERYNKAVCAFRAASKAKPNSQALDNQGNAHIELANMASNQEGKANELKKAIKCFDGAIQMKDKLARQWWATCHFDKARALALRAGKKNKREDLNKVAKELEETLNTFVAKPVGFDVPELFQDFENVKDDNEIKRLLERLREVILQARLKGD